MADTLAEIYNDTLVESDFTSGEATIITTNSSTAHVIKDVQAAEQDVTLKVNGTLEVNGFDVVGLTANSSGSEIIAPSSTVKVKSSTFPLTYTDYEIAIQSGSTNYSSNILPTVSGIEVESLSPIYDATNSMVSGISFDDTARIFAPHLGPNNYHLICWDNLDSTTQMRLIRDSDGAVVASEGSSYSPKWFDGKQYVYYYATTLGTGLHKTDCFTGTESLVVAQDFGGRTTYPRLFGIPNKYIFIWSEYTVGTAYVYDIQNDTVSTWLTSTPSTVFNFLDKRFFAVERSDGTVVILVVDNQSTIYWWEWTPGTTLNNSTPPTTNTLSLSGNNEHFRDYSAHHGTKGSRLYYVNNDSEKLSYIDFETSTPTVTNIGTTQISGAYGWDTQIVERTPSSATISGRSGYPSPSLKLRMTGVTST